MKIYKVGGAIRDSLIGLTPHDIDYVVVGGDHETMLNAGFIQVGKGFPVYLHPETKEEYALARTERKTGLKHTDFETFFDPSVTIEDDLRRRDLTINAIAQDIDTGEYIDPYNGIGDLKNKILRHVSEAFEEDPLRVLRVARFSAKFSDFVIAGETMYLMKSIAQRGDIFHLPKERLIQEFNKAFGYDDPYNFISVLENIGFEYIIGEDIFQSSYLGDTTFKELVKATSNLSPDMRVFLRMIGFYKSYVINLNTDLLNKKQKRILEVLHILEKEYFIDKTISSDRMIYILESIGIRNVLSIFPDIKEIIIILTNLDSIDQGYKHYIQKVLDCIEPFMSTKDDFDIIRKMVNSPMSHAQINECLTHIRKLNMNKIGIL